MFWPANPFHELKDIVLNALEHNSSFYNHNILGLPATYLDPKMFPANADFLENAPFIRSFVENPNHIGLHTYEKSLPAFKGTQKIELDLLRICAEKFLRLYPIDLTVMLHLEEPSVIYRQYGFLENILKINSMQRTMK